MGMFDAMDTAGTGVHMSRVWMDSISDNVANVNTVRPAGEESFRARLVIAQARLGQEGVQVNGIALKDGDPVRTYEPDHMYADADGYITRAHVDLAEEMTHMIVAQRGYQMNLSVMTQARDAYQAALAIGRGR